MNKYLDPADEYDIYDREQQKDEARANRRYQKRLEIMTEDANLVREAINEQDDKFILSLVCGKNELAERINEYIEERARELK